MAQTIPYHFHTLALVRELLRPIQEAIISFFKAETWEELVHEFGSEVLPEKLLWFAVSCGDSIWCANIKINILLVFKSLWKWHTCCIKIIFINV